MGWPRQFYLTGTDTDVGKTLTAAVLCETLGLAYWKPVQAGTSPTTDRQTVMALTSAPTFPEAYVFQRPASPHASAQDEDRRVELEAFSLPTDEPLLVEGAGGWMVPFAADPLLWQADLVRHLGLPVVLVTRSTLGTLNHTFLSLRALKADGVQVAGLVLVGPRHEENERDLVRYGGVPVLAHLPWVADPKAQWHELTASVSP